MTTTFGRSQSGRSLGQSMSSPSLGLSASMEGIPNLPGFRQSPATPKQVKQSLRVQHGYMLVRSGVPLRPITAPAPGSVALQRSMSFTGRDAGGFNDLSGRYSITSQQRDRLNSAHHLPYGEESKMPNFLKYDRKVLCFKAYYEEKVNESTLERQRVRKCLIYYYLENDTMQMVEPTEENSGIPQGAFIRRHRIPRPEQDGGAYYSVEDLYVGAELDVYKKRIKIYDCDEFTKQFIDANAFRGAPPGSTGYPRGDADDAGTVVTSALDAPSAMSSTQAMPCPEGEYNKMLRAKMQRETGADLTVKRNRRMHPMKQFMEAQLGKPQSVADLGSFLENDRKVLRFDCVWDDSARLYGDVLKFKLHYFLSDDTIEILQVHEKNNGRDPVPKLLSRRKLPLPQEQAKLAGGPLASSPAGPTKTEYYHWAHLVLGQPVVVFNRNLLVVDADPYTVFHYEKNGRALGRPIRVQTSRFRDELVQTPVPPFNGFGSEEDSLRSVYSIRPKKPTRDLSKSEASGQVMRFSIQMAHARDEDKQRVFTLQYYLIDDTMAIREPPLRNSGHIGGNFLSRSRVRKPECEQTNDPAPAPAGAVWGPAPVTAYYSAEDLHVGNILEFLGHKFTIFEADEYSLRYMEAHGAPKFPKSDLEAIVTKFSFATALSDVFDAMPPTIGGAVDFKKRATAAGVDIDLMECITVAREARRRMGGVPCETGPVDKAQIMEVMHHN